MEKYKIVRIRAFTLGRSIKKTEEYINKVSAKGIYEVVSVSFLRDCAVVTWKLK